MRSMAKIQYPSFSAILFLWVIFVALYAFLKNSAQDFAGILLAAAVIGSIAFAFLNALQVWKKAIGKAKLIFGFFLLALFCILINDIVYEVIFNILNVFHVTNISFTLIAMSWYHSLYFGFLLFQLLALIYLFPKITSFTRKWKDISLFIPFAIILLFMLLIFSVIFKLEMQHFSSFSVYNILHAILGFSVFILAMFCLACAKSKGLLYLSLGILIGKVGSLTMIFGTFAQKPGTGSPMEILWVFAFLVTAYGLMNFKQTETYNTDPKTWIYPVNSLRTQISFLLFTLFILSIFIYSVAYYLTTGHFFLENINALQAVFPILCAYSVMTVILSKLLTNWMLLPLNKIEKLVHLFMLAKEPDEPLQEKYYNMLEFNNLEKFLKKSFSVLKEKDQIKEELSACAAQVSHDIRSPVAALNIVLKDLPELAEQKKEFIKTAAQRIEKIANDLLKKYRLKQE